jgi:hypothetical protein
MQVALIEADPNTGGCTFRGCVPSQALLHAARMLDEAKHAAAFGVSCAKPYAAFWKSSICRIQLVSGFHLGKSGPPADGYALRAPVTRLSERRNPQARWLQAQAIGACPR